MTEIRKLVVVPLALGVVLGACADSRQEAIEGLSELDEAMRRHAAVYGRFPETIDPERPESPANLPYTSPNALEIRLLAVLEDSYGAEVRHGRWICRANVGPGSRVERSCTPTGGGSDSRTRGTGEPSPPLDLGLTPGDSSEEAAGTAEHPPP